MSFVNGSSFIIIVEAWFSMNDINFELIVQLYMTKIVNDDKYNNLYHSLSARKRFLPSIMHRTVQFPFSGKCFSILHLLNCNSKKEINYKTIALHISLDTCSNKCSSIFESSPRVHNGYISFDGFNIFPNRRYSSIKGLSSPSIFIVISLLHLNYPLWLIFQLKSMWYWRRQLSISINNLYDEASELSRKTSVYKGIRSFTLRRCSRCWKLCVTVYLNNVPSFLILYFDSSNNLSNFD